jgi:hypothetical protein
VTKKRWKKATDCWAHRAAVFVMAGMLAGCTAPASEPVGETPAPPASAPEVVELAHDACANRLHDICGGLLLYFMRYGDLPATLDVVDVPGVEADMAFACPVSGRSYVYEPQGIQMPERRQRIIMYDAAPSHAGMRWAIRIDEPVADQPLVARVIALPEAFFALKPAR